MTVSRFRKEKQVQATPVGSLDELYNFYFRFLTQRPQSSQNNLGGVVFV
jgi:hypothetical protein